MTFVQIMLNYFKKGTMKLVVHRYLYNVTSSEGYNVGKSLCLHINLFLEGLSNSCHVGICSTGSL